MQFSIVNLSQVKENDWRLDGEYWIDHKTYNTNFVKFNNSEYFKIIDGDRGNQYPSKTDFHDTGYCLFLNTSNVLKNGFVFDKCDFITQTKDNQLGNGKIQKGDIVFTTRGTIGNVGLYNDFVEYDNVRINSGMVIIRSQNIDQNFLFCYFQTNFFKKLVALSSTGSVQKQLPIIDMKKLPIPLLSPTFQNEIAQLVQRAFALQQSSQMLYKQAETLLLEELGLLNWKPKPQLWCVKNYSEATKVNRFDAEYFQLMYEEVEKVILNYKNGYSFIKDEFIHSKDIIDIDDKKEYNYIEIGSVAISNGNIEPLQLMGSELPDNAKRKLKKDQIIISKVRTYRGAVAIIDQDDYVGSGAFTILEAKDNSKINKETLYIFFKSKPFLSWSLKPNTGTSYPVIIDEDILNFPLPLLPQQTQQQISQKVVRSKEGGKTSKILLETAKKAVEMAIEEGEEAAMRFIKENFAES